MELNNDLANLFSYDEFSGEIRWKTSPIKGTRRANGRVAGCFDAHGYLQINVRGKVLKAHRLAWFLKTGDWPDGQIDHINHNRTDNRFENLRVVDNSGNHKNRPIQKNNTSGCAGVAYVKRIGKWRAYITLDGKQKNLGYYDSIEPAIFARKKGVAEYGYHENHGATNDNPTTRRRSTASKI